jgi:SAM-dependent methyltransferase
VESRTLAVQAALERDHWWYAGRRAVLRSLLPPIGEGFRILDAGCGPGGNRTILPEEAGPVALDPSPLALELTRRYPYRARLRGDLTRLPFPDACLDLVLALDVLEHLDDEMAGLREIRRVLRPGGRAVLAVPAFRSLWGLQDRLAHHRRRYRRPRLVAALREAGLEVERSTYFNTFLMAPIWAGRQLLRVIPHHLQSEAQIALPGLNGPLRALFASERFLLRVLDLPFGVSIFCLARRPG